MLNMNLNTILRCNNNGLRPINATSLAKFIVKFLFSHSDDLNLGKCRSSFLVLLIIGIVGLPEPTVANNQTINRKPVHTIRFDQGDTSILSEIRQKQFEGCLRTCRMLSDFKTANDSMKLQYCASCESFNIRPDLIKDTTNLYLFADSSSVTIYATNNVPQEFLDKYVVFLDSSSMKSSETIATKFQPSLLDRTIFMLGLLTIAAGMIAIISFLPHSS